MILVSFVFGSILFAQSIYLNLPQLTSIQVWLVFGPILFALSTAQDGSGSGIAIDNVQMGDDMLLQLKKVKTSFIFLLVLMTN